MPRIVSPLSSELDKLRQPLNESERRVFEFFDKNLPVEWEIYIQPHMNGLRPDFVLLNPSVGVGVFEVKGWNLDALEYSWNGNRLEGRDKNNNTFSLQKENPVPKVRLYAEEIKKLYCPRMSQPAGDRFALYSGVIFPCAETSRVRDLFANHAGGVSISGQDALDKGELHTVFPLACRPVYPATHLSHELAADLRLWLVEPDAPQNQRSELPLDKRQRELVTERTLTGYRRIKGPAGSGKSIVLAGRAARLAAEGKDVLVVSFNITLLNYLADLSVREYRRARSSIVWLNWHAWCKRVCFESGFDDGYKQAMADDGRSFDEKDDALTRLMQTAVIDIDAVDVRYDAVLVDEGQDFKPEWWSILRKVCKDGGEMMLVADATQNIYGTAGKWTDETMRGAGFRGEWVQVSNQSYRLPNRLQEECRVFGELFLPESLRDLPQLAQGDLALSDCDLRWVQLNALHIQDHLPPALKNMAAAQNASPLIQQEIDLLLKHDGMAASDLTILVDTNEAGIVILGYLKKHNIRCIDTFGGGKRAFYLGDGRVKLTTIASFKGWESRLLLVCITRRGGARTAAQLYTAMTRLKWHANGSALTVVCGDGRFAEYGRRWN